MSEVTFEWGAGRDRVPGGDRRRTGSAGLLQQSERINLLEDDLLRDEALLDSARRGDLEHQVEHELLHDQPNAPPHMKRMLVVSTGMKSWCGCFRPPWGGTFAIVPSRIFSSACWTPSPETSRVIDGFSPLRAILSTSSM